MYYADTTTQPPKELVWLPKELADKVKALDNGDAYESEILKFVDDSRRSLKSDIAVLDEEVLMYRAAMVKAKQALRKAFEEEMQDFEELWATHSDQFVGIRDKAKGVVDQLQPIKKELQDLKALMNDVQTWDVERLLKLLDQVNVYVGQQSDTGNILKFLFDNYKRA